MKRRAATNFGYAGFVRAAAHVFVSYSAVCAGAALMVGHAEVLVTVSIGNNDASPIRTFSSETGELIQTFVPAANSDGRGLAISGGVSGSKLFYTELGSGYGASDGIHVVPCSGGNETLYANPSCPPTGFGCSGIQDLELHNGVLYALTGYYTGWPGGPNLMIYQLDPATGDLIAGTSGIQLTKNTVPGLNFAVPQPTADGFTVLPDGDWLINDQDESTVYRIYKPDGSLDTDRVANGELVNLNNFSPPSDPNSPFVVATGVTLAPDGNSLYFVASTEGNGFSDWYCVQIHLDGTFDSAVKLAGLTGEVEDIAATTFDCISVQFSAIEYYGMIGPAAVQFANPDQHVEDSWNIIFGWNGASAVGTFPLFDTARHCTPVTLEVQSPADVTYVLTALSTNQVCPGLLKGGLAGGQFEDMWLVLHNVPSGTYDLYLYGTGGTVDFGCGPQTWDSWFELYYPASEGSPEETTPLLGWDLNTWDEGNQYVHFSGIQLGPQVGDAAIHIEPYPGCSPYAQALLNGLQLVKTQ